jgi:hypothetical protein
METHARPLGRVYNTRQPLSTATTRLDKGLATINAQMSISIHQGPLRMSLDV